MGGQEPTTAPNTFTRLVNRVREPRLSGIELSESAGLGKPWVVELYDLKKTYNGFPRSMQTIKLAMNNFPSYSIFPRSKKNQPRTITTIYHRNSTRDLKGFWLLILTDFSTDFAVLIQLPYPPFQSLYFFNIKIKTKLPTDCLLRIWGRNRQVDGNVNCHTPT